MSTEDSKGVVGTNKKNQTEIKAILDSLRAELKTAGVDAFIIPTADAHQSEYVSEHDKRRVFATGFTGLSFCSSLDEVLILCSLLSSKVRPVLLWSLTITLCCGRMVDTSSKLNCNLLQTGN
jgi:hypothetical protein